MRKDYTPGRFLLAGLMFMLFSTNLSAELIRYDVEIDKGNPNTIPIGHMLFDVTLGQSSNRDIWSSLQQWLFTWQGEEFSDQNSTPTNIGIFRIDEQSLQVISDGHINPGGSALACAIYNICPFFEGYVGFVRDDAEELYFSGFNNFQYPTFSETSTNRIIYAVSRIGEVPVPGTTLLLISALALLIFAQNSSLAIRSQRRTALSQAAVLDASRAIAPDYL